MIETLHYFLTHSFSWVLSNSLQASILVILILLCKLAGKKHLTARWHYAVWFLLMMKLAIPWSPDSSISLYNWLPSLGWETVQGQPANSASSNTYTAAAVAHPSGDMANEPKAGVFNGSIVSWLHLLASLWLCGVIVLLITTIRTMYKLSQTLKDEALVLEQRVLLILAHCKEQMGISQKLPLLRSKTLSSPTLAGVWRPRILLPDRLIDTLDEQELRHIFLHELSHWKRHDIAVNSLMSFLLILNWFNPLLWYAASRMRRDQEIACDALALTYMREAEVQKYGFTMIKLLELCSGQRTTALTASFSSSRNHLKRRIEMISSFKKKAYTWTTSGIIVVLALGVFTLTDAKQVFGKQPAFITPVEGTINSSPKAKGITIINALNTPVHAAAAGTVIAADYDRKAGNQVIVSHDGGYQTVYSHLEKLEVAPGATVSQGQIIGLLGSTGQSTGPHLYFELIKDGTAVDPLAVLADTAASN
ncbi:M56 family metallopeptidase [Brevibacillus reuszeri]|uniref:M56 family metallopeptidase n=1 Tax=Brevibacillus reuszeri TaxID=54915 RepID=UPI003672E0DA